MTVKVTVNWAKHVTGYHAVWHVSNGPHKRRHMLLHMLLQIRTLLELIRANLTGKNLAFVVCFLVTLKIGGLSERGGAAFHIKDKGLLAIMDAHVNGAIVGERELFVAARKLASIGALLGVNQLMTLQLVRVAEIFTTMRANVFFLYLCDDD